MLDFSQLHQKGQQDIITHHSSPTTQDHHLGLASPHPGVPFPFPSSSGTSTAKHHNDTGSPQCNLRHPSFPLVIRPSHPYAPLLTSLSLPRSISLSLVILCAPSSSSIHPGLLRQSSFFSLGLSLLPVEIASQQQQCLVLIFSYFHTHILNHNQSWVTCSFRERESVRVVGARRGGREVGIERKGKEEDEDEEWW